MTWLKPWAEPRYDDDGTAVWRVHVRSDLADGLADGPATDVMLSRLSSLGGISAIGRDPGNPQRLQLLSSFYVNHDNLDWIGTLFALAAGLQVADANAIATHIAEMFGINRASSAHPVSGARFERDEMLGAVDEMPLRKRPSKPLCGTARR